MRHLVFGRQGAGKSTLARPLADQHGGLRFAIDGWMAARCLADLPQSPDMGWILARVQRCEQLIWPLAAGLPLQRHFVAAPLALRRQRVQARTSSSPRRCPA